MAYGITSGSQLINLNTINQGCDIIDVAADAFIKASDQINIAADTCSNKALSVDGKSMQPSIEDVADMIKGVKNSVSTFTAAVRAEATNILAQQQQELAEYKKNNQ